MLSSTMATRLIDPATIDEEALLDLLSYELCRENVVAMSTDTVFGLIGQATKCDVIHSIAQIKGRPSSVPMPVLLGDLSDAESLVRKGASLAREFADVCSTLWPGPLTVVVPLEPGKLCDAYFTQETVGLRIPDNDRLRRIARLAGPLVATSANIHGEATPASGADVYQQLGRRGTHLNLSLVVDEASASSLPSTVVDLSGSSYRVLREGQISSSAIESAMRHHSRE